MRRKHARRRLAARAEFVCIIGAIIFLGSFVVWFATPVPTAVAHVAWQRWHMPQLALILDRRDAPLAMVIGNYYYGTVAAGNAAPAYDPALAARAFERALAIEPGILWGHYALARIYFARGDFADALSEINAELAANPENRRALYVRGLIYGYRNLPGDLALAEGDFRNFNAWAPSEWAGYNDLAWILAKEGKYADVEALMQTAFAQVPGGKANPWLWNELGVAQLALGDAAAARASLENAQAYAASLTQADWYRAYSGDNPVADAGGLAAFKAGIAENLAKAEAGG